MRKLLALVLLLLTPALALAQAPKETPSLAGDVQAGKVPPIAQRLPAQPLVVQAQAGARPDTPEGVLARLAEQGVDRAAVRALLEDALVSPVLTAHPSEVRRKSVIDRIAAITSASLTSGCRLLILG